MNNRFRSVAVPAVAILLLAGSPGRAQNFGVAKDLARKAVRAVEERQTTKPKAPKPEVPKPTAGPEPPPEYGFSFRDRIRQGAAEMVLIDAHAHYGAEHPKVLEWMARQNVKVLNICVGGRSERWRRRVELYRQCAREHPDRCAWVTSFTLPDFKEPDYAEKVIKNLEKDFADGAVGCKIWKSVGMFIKKPDGSYLQIDDPIFEPIFAWLKSEGHTLVAHLADPIGRWRPLDRKDPYYDLYKKSPDRQMYGREGVPSHGEILAALDRVMDRHPNLRVVGCHLGSMEHDLDRLGKRLDKYPNFAVDTSGLRRITALARQDRAKVRAFFIKYADRIMYGSDRHARGQLEMNEEELDESLDALRGAFQAGWDYYATDRTFMLKGCRCHGLDLPRDVVKKIFNTTAKKWHPGL